MTPEDRADKLFFYTSIMGERVQQWPQWTDVVAALRAAEADAREQEREACAKVADQVTQDFRDSAEGEEGKNRDDLNFVRTGYAMAAGANRVADAIRNRATSNPDAPPSVGGVR